MKSKKTLKIIAASVMLIAGIFNILFQFSEYKVYIYISVMGYLLFGIFLVIDSVYSSKNEK